MTGTRTAVDPFTIVTVVSLGAGALRISETDSYVVGEESYRADVTVTNLGETPRTAILYRAGDCFLQNSDAGFGSADPSTGAVSCVAGVDDGNGNIVPGPRIEQWFPLSAGSHYLENNYSNVWAAIGAQTSFTDSCVQCATYVDNGAGLSWDLTLPIGASATRSHLTVFSPLGRAPLSTTKTADSAAAASGGTDGYTITIHNPNTQAVSLDAITDTLPDGFSVPGRLHDRRDDEQPLDLRPAAQLVGTDLRAGLRRRLDPLRRDRRLDGRHLSQQRERGRRGVHRGADRGDRPDHRRGGRDERPGRDDRPAAARVP